MRKQSCVSNSFMIFVQALLKEYFPQLNNPFADKDLIEPFMRAYWNKEKRAFRNDLEKGGDIVSSDANIIPFLLKIVVDDNKLKSSIDAIKKEKLDKPFPLKYHSGYDPVWMKNHLATKILMPNYQGNSIWGMLAPFYIDLESKFYPKKAKDHLRSWMNLIEKYGTYIEVFEPDGSGPLRGNFGHRAETGMFWAASIPPLAEKFDMD